MYTCSACGTCFTRSDNLRRHERSSCNKLQNDNDGLSVKIQKLNPQPSTSSSVQTCNCCNKTVANMYSHMRTIEHRTNSCVPLRGGIQVVRSAFKCRIVSYRVHSENYHLDYVRFFTEIKNDVVKLLEEVVQIHKSVKVNMEVFGRYILHTQELSDTKSFNTSNIILDLASDLTSAYDNFIDKMISKTTEFQERDSGIVLIYFIWYPNCI